MVTLLLLSVNTGISISEKAGKTAKICVENEFPCDLKGNLLSFKSSLSGA
jgi:hypothetical protein